MTALFHRARIALTGATAATALALIAAPIHTANATEPGHNGRIAFTRWAPSQSTVHVMTMFGDGTDQRNLGEGAYPGYTTGGSKLAFFGEGVEVMAPDGTNREIRIPSSDSLGFRPSPDGEHVGHWDSYASTSMPRIVIENLHDQSKRYLFDRPDLGEYYFGWSPDGSRIVYSTAASFELRIVNSDGTDDHVVPTPGVDIVEFPSFSPDGTTVVFSAKASDAASPRPTLLYAVDTDGTDLRQVGPTDGWNGTAVFSPDGTKIAFTRSTVNGPNSAIWVMDSDGTDTRQLTSGPYDEWPDWQPLAEPAPNLSPRALGTTQNKVPRALFANAGAAFDGDGSIVKYEWRWGDNTPVSPHKYAWHRYASPGTYLVRLTVTDDDGARSTKKAWVKVQ